MRRALALALVLSLAACSGDPKQVRVTEANQDKVLEEVKDAKGLTVDESRMLFAFLMRRTLAAGLGQSPPPIAGKTVGDLIADQRAFEEDAKKRDAAQAKLATEARAKEDAIAAELRKALTLTVFEKGFIPSDAMAGRYHNLITIKCAYENTSGKDIRAFTGAVRFTDLFDKPVFETSLTVANPIKAGAKATWSGSIDYNQFTDSHRSLRNAELANMKVVWLPKSIIYADGIQAGKTE